MTDCAPPALRAAGGLDRANRDPFSGNYRRPPHTDVLDDVERRRYCLIIFAGCDSQPPPHRPMWSTFGSSVSGHGSFFTSQTTSWSSVGATSRPQTDDRTGLPVGLRPGTDPAIEVIVAIITTLPRRYACQKSMRREMRSARPSPLTTAASTLGMGRRIMADRRSRRTGQLLRQDLFEEFCDEFTREMNRLRMEHRASLSAAEREIERIEVRRKKLVESIMEGVPASEVKDELNANAARREALKTQLAVADAPAPLLHPEMAGLYRKKVTALAQALEQPETRTEASQALRGLVDAIVLTPSQGELQIELKGNLAAMLGAAQNAKRSPETGDLSLQVVMVAGARSQLYLEFTWTAA
jgi:hypothetical protein